MKRLKDVNWNHLYYFYETARLNSVKKVAEYVNSSSSTISEQIKKLEKTLDTQLFKRTRGGLLLTQEGETLFEHASLIFDEGYRVLEKFSKGDFGGYSVTVGVDSAIFSPLSAYFIQQYWDGYAQYGLVNTLKQPDHDVLIQNIVHENIDWGLSLTPSKRKSLTSQIVGNYKMSFCCAPFIYDKFKKKKDIIYYLPYVELAKQHPIKRKLANYLRSAGISLNEVCHTDNFHYMLSLLEAGRAISILPDDIIKKNPNLKAFQSQEKFEYSIYAIWKNINQGLISISTLRALSQSRLKGSSASRFLQLEANSVPKDILKP